MGKVIVAFLYFLKIQFQLAVHVLYYIIRIGISQTDIIRFVSFTAAFASTVVVFIAIIVINV